MSLLALWQELVVPILSFSSSLLIFPFQLRYQHKVQILLPVVWLLCADSLPVPLILYDSTVKGEQLCRTWVTSLLAALTALVLWMQHAVCIRAVIQWFLDFSRCHQFQKRGGDDGCLSHVLEEAFGVFRGCRLGGCWARGSIGLDWIQQNCIWKHHLALQLSLSWVITICSHTCSFL